MQQIITIDGPAGSGKSTTARLVATALEWQYLDTGAMYRAIGLAMVRSGIDPTNEAAVCANLEQYTVDLGHGDPPVTLLNGEDVSALIRTPSAAQASSQVAAIGCVREKLVAAQQRIGAGRPCVLEGRDTGTVVFPGAGLKVYLDAPVRMRAERRLQDLGDNPGMSLDEMVREVETRDERDRNRAHSPLGRAEDAVVVDTGDLSIEQQVERVLELARQRFGLER